MLHICMIAYTHYPTDSRVRREAEALVERGDVVDMICLGGDNEKSIEDFQGVKLVKILKRRYRGSNVFMYLVSYLQFLIVATFKVSWMHLRYHYHVIQIHTMPDFMVFSAIIPKIFGAVVILDVHDLMPELYQSKFGLAESHWLIRLITLIEHLSINFADRAIAVHQPHLEVLLRHGNAKEKFTVLINLPDEKLFSCQPVIKEEKNSVFELIYHGTLAKRNGLELAIRAVSSLRDEIAGLKLIIWGDGDDVDRLSGIVKELGIQEWVDIHKGMVPMEQLVPVIQKASVGIVPILYDNFTRYMLPVKILEYVALGIPVICSRTETIQTYFDDSMVEFFQPGDVEDLAHSIISLYQNADRRNEIIQNSLKFNQMFSWSKQKQVYYQLIDDLCKNK